MRALPWYEKQLLSEKLLEHFGDGADEIVPDSELGITQKTAD